MYTLVKQFYDQSNENATLTEIFNATGGDKGSYFTHVNSNINIAHNYTETYEHIMSPFRHSALNILEIGLKCPYFPGASIKGWNAYFTNANYFGIDIVDCSEFNTERIHTDIVDQTSEEQLINYIKNKSKFKFIIDDGVHTEPAVTISLGTLFPHLESKGVYFIEDLHVIDIYNIKKLASKNFTSPYISADKINYINEHIDNCYFTNNEKLCIIYKK